MNDVELKTLWRRQPLKKPDTSAEQLLSAMHNKTTLLRRCLNARDLRELIACAVVIIAFGYFCFNERLPMVRLGWLIIIGSTLFIAWRIIQTRRATPPAPPGATVIESLRAELNSVRAQARLLGSVLWWYLLPLGIGLLVATWGMPIDLHAKIRSTLIYGAIYALIYWLNQRARSKQLIPLESQLESLLHSAETGEPLDETVVADLRPIALSMSATDQRKPVEFRVAFGQIAPLAEIGFVGAWFFYVLGVTEGDIAQIFTPSRLAWGLLSFLAGLAFSWILQKGTERAVGIGSLGIYLLGGHTFIPWDEIKAVRPLRILHIRSLWLIRESGKKEIMPWTSLERRSDLKAAVEAFAPADHPIREYLSLLRRT